MVELRSKKFLYFVVSVYHIHNGARIRENKRARKGMENGSILPGRSPLGDTYHGPHLQAKGCTSEIH